MKITDLHVHVVTPLPGASPGWVFVELLTDAGISGVGECSSWPGESNAIVAAALEQVRPLVVGQPANRIEAIWTQLYRRFTFSGSRGVFTTVMSGIDIALWDLRGKLLDRPVYDLLGGPVRDDVPLYTHAFGATREEVLAMCRQRVAEGFTALKVDPFQLLVERERGLPSGEGELSFRGGQDTTPALIAEGAEIVAAMREVGGPSLELMVDAHGQFDVPSALRAIRAVEPYDLVWFEEPLPPESIAALRQLRRQTTIDLCAGERLFTRWDVLPLLREGLVSYVMPDVCWTGGISELKKIATLAEAHYVPISPHNALGPLQVLAGAHTMMTVPNLYRLEVSYAWKEAYDSLLSEPLDIAGGRLRLSERPGLGVELDHDAIERHLDPAWAASVGRDRRA